MNINIETVHFSISEELDEFAKRKTLKAFNKYDDIISIDIIMKLVKPEAKNNKEAEIRLTVPGNEMFAKKTSDSFEESIDTSIEAIKKQLVKHKEKVQGR